jgi:hypothetical protein
MKSAKDGVRFDASGPLNRARERSIFVQRPVRSDVVVIAGVSFQNPTCAGLRWTSPPPPCTSAGSSRGRPAPIRSSGTNYAPYGGSSANRSPSRPLCSPPSAVRPSARQASHAWWNGQAGRPSWVSRRTPICSGTRVATRWPIRGTIRALCRPTSAIATFSTQSGTPNCRRRGSRTFGDGKLC